MRLVMRLNGTSPEIIAMMNEQNIESQNMHNFMKNLNILGLLTIRSTTLYACVDSPILSLAFILSKVKNSRNTKNPSYRNKFVLNEAYQLGCSLFVLYKSIMMPLYHEDIQEFFCGTAMETHFTSVQWFRAYSPKSRPCPDSLKPPNGD